MATPWYIKVRADLHTDARVLRISEIIDPQGSLASAGLFGTSQLSVTTVLRDVSTAALQRVWIHACNHTCDGVFRHVTSLAYLDTLAGYPKFGEAMAAVGWAEFDKTAQTITLPNFLNWNTPAKSGPRGGRPGNPESPGAIRTRKSRQNKTLQPPVTTQSQPRNNGATSPSQADIGRGRGTEEERESTAQPPAAGIDPVGMTAEVIALAYPRQDDPIGTMAIIADDLLAGQDSEQMRLAVQRCANFIRKAPGGSANRYVPSARSFFAERQWRSPEAFESRWQNDGHDSAQSAARKPVKLTTPPKNGF